MYYRGIGVSRDYAKATKWFRRAALNANSDAEFYMGVIYDDGDGIKQDPIKAVEWYRRAAAAGNLSAQFNLGAAYDFGHGRNCVVMVPGLIDLRACFNKHPSLRSESGVSLLG